jgi:hypothetical protein
MVARFPVFHTNIERECFIRGGIPSVLWRRWTVYGPMRRRSLQMCRLGTKQVVIMSVVTQKLSVGLPPVACVRIAFAMFLCLSNFVLF